MTRYIEKKKVVQAFRLPDIYDIDAKIHMEEWVEKHKYPTQEFGYIGNTLRITFEDGVIETLAPGDWLVLLHDGGIVVRYSHKEFMNTYQWENPIYEYDGGNLHGWFGLSYASWLALPRVLMMDMPKEWQQRMADLLEEYSEAFPSLPYETLSIQGLNDSDDVIDLPDWLNNYRHPDKEEIKKVRSHDG